MNWNFCEQIPELKKKDPLSFGYWKKICDIYAEEYRNDMPLRLKQSFWDVVALYKGYWSDFEACQVGYHTLTHALEVTLASARMIAGWNREHDLQFPVELFEAAIVASMFHDAGYIKDKGDKEGKGGKFTFTHVKRSMNIACNYLKSHAWPKELTDIIVATVELTEFNRPVEFKGPISEGLPRAVGSIVATADLIAQIADIHYVEKLHYLLEEFEEAYAFEGEERLKEMGIKKISSIKEMMDEAPSFFIKFIIPRLEALGRMDKYLTSFFGIGRNPYHECIAANLFRTITTGLDGWRYIGEVLKDFNFITSETIDYSLNIQKKLAGTEEDSTYPPNEFLNLFRYINSIAGRKCLGEILIELGYITPEMLRQAVAEQCLSTRALDFLSKEDLFMLVRTGMLLNQMKSVPSVFTQVLEIISDTIPCKAISILIPDEEAQHLVIAAPIGPNAKELQGVKIPIGHGIAGWVFNHAKPSIVNQVEYDSRFFQEPDKKTGFRTKNIAAVPLMNRGRTVGVLEAINKTGNDNMFCDRDIWLLNAIAMQIAGVLENLVWFIQLNHKGSMDGQ